MSWSTLSNAFLKSTNKARTEPFWSIVWHHQWRMETLLCTPVIGERELPKWLLSFCVNLLLVVIFHAICKFEHVLQRQWCNVHPDPVWTQLQEGASVPIYRWHNWAMTNFGAVLFRNDLRVKQYNFHRRWQMSNYTQRKFRLQPHGANWGTSPWSSALNLPWLGGLRLCC